MLGVKHGKRYKIAGRYRMARRYKMVRSYKMDARWKMENELKKGYKMALRQSTLKVLCFKVQKG